METYESDEPTDTCKTCAGSGEVTALTEINPTMHEANPPHRTAAMVTCGACAGTGKVAKG